MTIAIILIKHNEAYCQLNRFLIDNYLPEEDLTKFFQNESYPYLVSIGAYSYKSFISNKMENSISVHILQKNDLVDEFYNKNSTQKVFNHLFKGGYLVYMNETNIKVINGYQTLDTIDWRNYSYSHKMRNILVKAPFSYSYEYLFDKKYKLLFYKIENSLLEKKDKYFFKYNRKGHLIQVQQEDKEGLLYNYGINYSSGKNQKEIFSDSIIRYINKFGILDKILNFDLGDRPLSFSMVEVVKNRCHEKSKITLTNEISRSVFKVYKIYIEGYNIVLISKTHFELRKIQNEDFFIKVYKNDSLHSLTTINTTQNIHTTFHNWNSNPFYPYSVSYKEFRGDTTTNYFYSWNDKELNITNTVFSCEKDIIKIYNIK